MSEKDQSATRRKKRYSHIYISLSVKVGFKWELIKALDWNEDGFNFYLGHDLPYSNVLFKKGQSKFAGKIMWRKKNDDDIINLEMTLNKLLFEQINKQEDMKGTFSRIVNLMRSEGRVDEKKTILGALNPNITEDEIKGEFETQKMENPTYRYGIKVSSEIWTESVNYALKASSAVQAIDNLGKGLSKLADDVEKKDTDK